MQLIDWLRQKVGFGGGQAGRIHLRWHQSNLMGVLLARDCVSPKTIKMTMGQNGPVQRDGIPTDAMQK